MRFLRSKKGNKPPANRYAQQKARSWRPILTPLPVVILMTLVGLVFLGFGIALFFAWSKTTSTDSYRYDDACSISKNKTCIVEFEIKETLKSPVYFYYDLDGHFHNYRLFVRSRSDWQLKGYTYDVTQLSACDPHRTKNDDDNDQDEVFLPCGEIPRNLFSDKFQLYDPRNRSVSWTKHDIEWDAEYDYKYKNPPKNEKGVRVIENFRDPDFIVWMRSTRFNWYIKLYGIIHHDIRKGTYQMHINNTWEVSRYGGYKYFYFSTTSWIGGPNIGIAIAFVVVGGISLLMALLFLLKHVFAGRPLGDHSLIDWGRETFMPS